MAVTVPRPVDVRRGPDEWAGTDFGLRVLNDVRAYEPYLRTRRGRRDRGSDRRSVVSPEQALSLLGAVGDKAPRLVAAFGSAPDGRLFVTEGYGNGPVSEETYARVCRQARASALTAAHQRSPHARVPAPAPARGRVAMAERRCPGNPGRRVGR